MKPPFKKAFYTQGHDYKEVLPKGSLSHWDAFGMGHMVNKKQL